MVESRGSTIDLAPAITAARGREPMQVNGKVTDLIGTVIEGHVPETVIGALCELHPAGGQRPVAAEIVGFRDDKVLLMPLEDMRGLKPGSRIVVRQSQPTVRVGPELLGRVLDGLGQPIDGGGPMGGEADYPIYAEPINPMARPRITEALDVGIRAINALLTIAVGQRMAIMAGSGVGKSVLMGMMARHTVAEVNVIALIGERGREIKEFIERDLGPEGLRRSVVVTATSDHSPLMRVKGAFLATAIAEYFRDRGAHVLFMMDSVTRLAMAQREVGLAVGEPPTSKGYTPSVLAMLPRLLERAGTGASGGSITGLYTVLVEGDDFNDPIADAIRATVDGHIVLSRELAAQNHYPAIDVMNSKSRLMIDITSPEHMQLVQQILEWLVTHQRVEMLLNIGAYTRGTSPQIDEAVTMHPQIMAMLRQPIAQRVSLAQADSDMAALVNRGSRVEDRRSTIDPRPCDRGA
jgi:flagellum-specific ATP synthase